jgi:gamma-glutamylcyclotransferase (GGCT)/AIG2-like uncharacterized protein YtfP
MPLLFVYGSLKRGFRLHRHLQPGRFLGAAHTEPGYALYRLDWYPGMVAEPGSGVVTGELYEIPEALLPFLDEVESVPHLYQRAQIEINCLAHAPAPSSPSPTSTNSP